VKSHIVRVLIVAAGGVAGFIIGSFVGSPVGWTLSGLLLGAAGVVVAMVVREEFRSPLSSRFHEEDIRQQPPQGPMKKLLFDDFQSSASGGYVVREIEESEEHTVVPSTKAARPAPAPLKEETVRELTIVDFFDLDSDPALTDIEPKSEFHALLDKVLLVIKDVVFAHTVAFFWVNRDKGEMILESMATDSDQFMSGRRFAAGNDLVSKVALEAKPQLLGSVSAIAESELLRYYDSPASIRSVICVPVFFRSVGDDIKPVGVIVADSKADDAFGAETFAILGRMTKLVSALIKSYTDKYDLLLDSELLNSLRRMQDRIASAPTEETVLTAIADEANRLAAHDAMSVVMYSEEAKGWVVQRCVNKQDAPYVAAGDPVEVPDSITGASIAHTRIETEQDLAASTRHRFRHDEPSARGGSFVSIPISSLNRCYGAIALEHAEPGAFNGNDVEKLYRLVQHAGSALEVLYMQNLVREFVSLDHLMGLTSRKHFMKRLEDEVLRAEDCSAELSLISVTVDNLDELVHRWGKDSTETILNEVAKLMRGHVRPYDTVGVLERNTVGILLVETVATDAYLWAEKVRRLVAGHVIEVAGRTLSVTVSVGVCGLSEGMHAEDLVRGATRVLENAIEGGGNLVRVV
jgi:diguanylate cyclase (GGDEF)-like protein